MSEKDIESKIIDVIKKSPIGVTSSEIARYLGISRITITKYLAIIKERAQIDFKQFGMAKLWFIPVNLNKEVFLGKITNYLASNFYKGGHKEALRLAGFDMGKYLKEIYSEHYRTQDLSYEQIIEIIIDAYKKSGGNIFVVDKDVNKVNFRCKKSPFSEDLSDSYILFQIHAGILGNLLKSINGYAKVCLRPIDKDLGLYDILVYMRKTKKSEEFDGIEYETKTNK